MTDQKTRDALAFNLKAWMAIRGLTQVELAKRAGVKQATISRFVRGERGGHVDTLVRLCRALDCNPNDLLQGAVR